MEKQKIFLRGVDLFNAGHFYESHEAWESIWLKDKSEGRSFYQGLIVAAGGLHHFQKGRTAPCLKALQKALLKLEAFPPVHHGIELRSLVKDIRNFLGRMAPPFPRITVLPP